MVTCPRDVDYSKETLANLSDWNIVPTIHHDDNKEGPVPAWFECLKLLVRRASKMASDPPIMILQDDLEFVLYPGCFLSFPERENSLLSLFTVNRPETVHKGWCRANTEDARRRKVECDGGLAFAMGYRTAVDLLCSYEDDLFIGHSPITNLPELLGEYCARTGLDYYIAPMNCVKHTGEVPARDGYPDGFKWNTNQERPKARL